MPELSLKDTIVTSLTAQEPWPDNVKLFQPYEVEQILLPDNASCLAVQAFLKMCNLPFEVEMRWNAEFMSPSGRVPFIKCGAFVVSELEPIVQFAANKGISLCSQLSSEEKAEMRAYMSLITNVLVNAELYISWLDEETFNSVTKVRNSSVYPWPLSWIQTRSKRGAVAKRLKALHWHDKSLEQVRADVEQCCNSLSQRLGDKDFFFGTPTPLDALISGHVRALLGGSGPRARLMIKPITSVLLRHTLRVARLTRMRLTSQEEYLVCQAYQFYRSPTRSNSEKSSHSRPSRLSFKYENCDSYGYKPFASTETLNDETLYDSQARKMKEKQSLNYIDGVMEEILDKVDEIALECEKCYYVEKSFEVIPTDNFADVTDFLDTIDENDLSNDTTVDTSLNDDMDVSLTMDSDGLINDKLLEINCRNDVTPPEEYGDRVPRAHTNGAIPIMRGSSMYNTNNQFYRNSRRVPSSQGSPPSPRSPLRSVSPSLGSTPCLCRLRSPQSPSYSPNNRQSLTPCGSPNRTNSPPPFKHLATPPISPTRRLSPTPVRRLSAPLSPKQMVDTRSLSPNARRSSLPLRFNQVRSGSPPLSPKSPGKATPPLSPKKMLAPVVVGQCAIVANEAGIQGEDKHEAVSECSPPRSLSPNADSNLSPDSMSGSPNRNQSSSSTSSPDQFFSESKITLKVPSKDSVNELMMAVIHQPVMKTEIMADLD